MLITQYLTHSTSRAVYLVLHRFFSVFALTVDRLLGIHLHLRYQVLVTHKSVVVVVSSVWVLSAFIALLGLKWIQILGFISIQLQSEEE